MSAPPIDAVAIKRAAEVLRRGGIVALPTETVYGLAADAENEDAVRKLFAAKGRPADHPVIVHVSGADAFDDWAVEVPDAARVLARAFWPGPLTLVLKRSAGARDIVTGGQDTVGLRAPAHPWTRAVLHAFGGALAAPSANSFGRVSPTTAQHVVDDLGVKPRGKVDLVVDGGACPVGIESTIVDACSDLPTLLRPGAVTRDQLQRTLGLQIVDAGARSPRTSGRLEKHYAPQTPLTVMPVDALSTLVSKPGGARLALLAPLGLLQHCRANVALAIAAAEHPDEYA
ncbi:MAG TPA: L-threonylcarbamoyladenylate synthase, partial [Burkholderiaceae bacterium]|nr:L-threonylcarbamoyladenylate synthase [Burkholderiaceae bacterium]